MYYNKRFYVLEWEKININSVIRGHETCFADTIRISCLGCHFDKILFQFPAKSVLSTVESRHQEIIRNA